MCGRRAGESLPERTRGDRALLHESLAETAQNGCLFMPPGGPGHASTSVPEASVCLLSAPVEAPQVQPSPRSSTVEAGNVMVNVFPSTRSPDTGRFGCPSASESSTYCSAGRPSTHFPTNSRMVSQSRLCTKTTTSTVSLRGIGAASTAVTTTSSPARMLIDTRSIGPPSPVLSSHTEVFVGTASEVVSDETRGFWSASPVAPVRPAATREQNHDKRHKRESAMRLHAWHGSAVSGAPGDRVSARFPRR